MPFGIRGDTRRAVKLAIIGAFFSKFVDKITLAVKNLNSEISRVGHENLPFRRNRDVPRAIKLSVGISVTAELEQWIPVDVKDVYSVVVAISDNDSVIGIHSNPTRTFELS